MPSTSGEDAVGWHSSQGIRIAWPAPCCTNRSFRSAMRRLMVEIDRQSDAAHSAIEKNRPDRTSRDSGCLRPGVFRSASLNSFAPKLSSDVSCIYVSQHVDRFFVASLMEANLRDRPWTHFLKPKPRDEISHPRETAARWERPDVPVPKVPPIPLGG